jgi:peptide/nickel transport system substrate-binding protein
MDMMFLLHEGAGTTYVDPFGMTHFNQRVVKEMERIVNADGSITYEMELFDDWVFNDGTPVTAQNYVFNILLWSSEYIVALDGNPTGGFRYVGYRDFLDGVTETFAGVRLLGEHKFSITIDPEWLPFYWEFTYAGVNPIAMHVLAPGVSVADDGQGAYFVGPISAEMLRETYLDPVTGYRYNPRVTIGPYQLVEASLPEYCILERNMLFKGHWDYSLPLINEIIMRHFSQATYVAALEAGQGHIVTGVTGFGEILDFLAMVDQGILWDNQYDRPGFGYLAFQADHGPTRHQEVRQASAWLIDRDELIRIFLGGLAAVVNSDYATAQYIYQDNRDWLEDNLDHWTLNPAMANQILDEGGWIYNADGTERTPGSSTLRHKMVDGELEPLIIKWLGSDSSWTFILEDLWVPSAAEVGMEVSLTVVEFATLNQHWGRSGAWTDEMKEYHAFNLAVNFTSVIVAYWNMYSIHDEFMGAGWNNFFIRNQELYDQTMIMYNATTKEEYDAAWLQVLLMLNQQVVRIPIYANIWFDFVRFDSGLENYHGSSYWNFRHAVQRAWIAK